MPHPDRRLVVIVTSADRRDRALLWDGRVEELAEEMGTDAEILRHYEADEILRPPHVRFGRAICLDGPLEGRLCYAARTPTGHVRFQEGTYVVDDPEADVITLRYLQKDDV